MYRRRGRSRCSGRVPRCCPRALWSKIPSRKRSLRRHSLHGERYPALRAERHKSSRSRRPATRNISFSKHAPGNTSLPNQHTNSTLSVSCTRSRRAILLCNLAPRLDPKRRCAPGRALYDVVVGQRTRDDDEQGKTSILWFTVSGRHARRGLKPGGYISRITHRFHVNANTVRSSPFPNRRSGARGVSTAFSLQPKEAGQLVLLEVPLMVLFGPIELGGGRYLRDDRVLEPGLRLLL